MTKNNGYKQCLGDFQVKINGCDLTLVDIEWIIKNKKGIDHLPLLAQRNI